MAAAALALLVLFGVVIRIRHKDGTETVVEVPEGSQVVIETKGSEPVKPPAPVGLDALVPQPVAIRGLQGHTGPVTCVALTPDAKYAVSGSKDCSVRVWDVATGREVACFLGHGGTISDIDVLPDGKRVLSVADGSMILWELRTANVIRRFRLKSAGRISVSPDGKQAVCSGDLDGKGGVCLFELATEKKLGHAATGTSSADIKALDYSPDGKHALCGMYDSTLRLVNLETFSEVKRLPGHSQRVTGVAISREGRRAVSGSWDQKIRIWDLAKGRTTALMQGKANVSGVDISADGRRAVSCYVDMIRPEANAYVHLWDADTGREIAHHQQHTLRVTCVAISPDGRWAVSGSDDKTLCLWRLPEPAAIPSTITDPEGNLTGEKPANP